MMFVHVCVAQLRRFQDSVRSRGWHHGDEETLFDALSKDQEAIVAEDMPRGRNTLSIPKFSMVFN